MKQEIEAIRKEAEDAVTHAGSTRELEEIRVRFLGKKGRLTTVLRGMGQLSPEERPVVGQLANQAREQLEAALTARSEALARAEEEKRLGAETIDVTLPGRELPRGHLHPLRQVWSEIEAVFRGMGYDVAEGPEVEWDRYNFELLNMPKNHPARDMQDSFYVTEDIVLRTHTSPVQIRYMLDRQPQLPVRMIAPGRVYRRDDDATHSPMFHQVEGLHVDRGISLGDLKGALESFVRVLYGEDARMRLRPSYFPFTEPSVEVDMSCMVCGGSGCRTCGHSGWIEILGAGMVHPEVLRNGGYEPEEVSGFAFGMGIERIAMLKYGIDDLRLFFQNDLRFIRQF